MVLSDKEERFYVMKKNKNNTRNRFVSFLLWGLCTIFSLLILAVIISTNKYKRKITAENSPEKYQVHGIDISHHQKQINWDEVCKARLHGKPISFVFIKCTEGKTKLDKNYIRNYKEIHNHKLKFGAYHFFNPGKSPNEQAQNFIRNSNLQEGDLVPVLDVESKGRLSKQELINDVLQWLKIVGKHYNCIPILYTSFSFRNRHLNDERISHYPFWKAHYQNKQIVTGKNWTFCQYTHQGHVNGIKDGKNNYVDLNVFRGTPEDLQSLTISAH